MPTYAIAGTALDMDIEVPGLIGPVEPAEDVWTVRRSDELAGGELERVGEVRAPGGALWAVIHAGAHGYRLTYPDRAEVDVEPTGRRVRYRVSRDLSDPTLRHLIIDQVLPYLLVADGALVLHASCVALGDRAVAFVGPSGIGKSSLAGGFAQRGAGLLSDDFLHVREQEDGGYLAVPVYPGLRLWPDGADFFGGAAHRLPAVADYTDKRRWEAPAGPALDAPLPLAALVAPGSEPAAGQPDVRIGRIRGADALTVVAEQAFGLERRGRARIEADLDRYLRLLARVPVHLVEYRRRYDLLPSVLDAIETAVLEA